MVLFDVHKNLSIEQRKLLDEHLRLVLAYNRHTNLTRIDSWEDGQLLHIEDSLQGLPFLQQAPSGKYVDIGSGAGYPGIPLALISERPTWLVDSVSRKAQALQKMIDKLGTEQQINVYAERVEDLALQMPHEFAAATARAVSSLPSLMELAAPLLFTGGLLICYKAQLNEEELCAALALKDKLGMALVEQKEFVLSDQSTQRTLFVFKKIGDPQVVLPRRAGMAQKRPYKN